MTEPTMSRLINRNPDVLTCIANLSNDEVFTPPAIANAMLDVIEDAWAADNDGANIWTNPDVKFLDPATKTGVFLREITRRLTEGLAEVIPDLQKRVDHILTKQVYGIGITHLTSLLARRSLYCSKLATSKHSIAKGFKEPDGNIWFEPLKHTWVGGKKIVETADEYGNPQSYTVDGRCKFCGARQTELDRNSDLESHAYLFIHSADLKAQIKAVFGGDVQFDVIVGNPPYQLNDGGGSGTSAMPIYHRFVAQAKALEPRYLAMVIQARWFAGGKGLDEFRDSMLSDARLRVIEDFPDSNDVFPGTQIKGGICYFLWNRDFPGPCRVTNHDKVLSSETVERPLLEHGVDVFIRYNGAIEILRKVMRLTNGENSSQLTPVSEKRFASLVSKRRPFGDIESLLSDQGDVLVYQVGAPKYASSHAIEDGMDALRAWKVFIPFLASGSDAFPHPILGRPFVGAPMSATTETNLVIGPFESELEARNVLSYVCTRFFRFLVLLRKPSQNATRKVYEFVPMQDFSRPWDDATLYKIYGLSAAEISFIESMVRVMEPRSE